MANFAAFLIGINDYDYHEELNLDYAVHDVESLKEIFTLYKPFGIQNSNIFDITSNSEKSPSRSNILEIINSNLRKSHKGVVFYFSGHGFSLKGIPYLKPCDYKEDKDGNPIIDTAISVNDLLDIFDLDIDEIIFIIDACRSEYDENENFDKNLANCFPNYTSISKYKVLLQACSFDEETSENSELGLGSPHGFVCL